MMIDYRFVTPEPVKKFIGAAIETSLDMAYAWIVFWSRVSATAMKMMKMVK